jgi:hypothetical protein
MRVRRIVALALLVTQAGCTSVRLVPAPLQYIPQKQPSIVWVVDSQEEILPISQPTVRADSVVGLIANTTEPISVPMSRTRYVLARQPDRRRTAFLIGGMGVLAGVTAWVMTTAGSGRKDCTNLENPSGRPWC